MLIGRVRLDGRVRLGRVDADRIRLLDVDGLGIDQASTLGAAALAAAGWTDVEPLPLGPPIDLGTVEVLAPIPLPPKIIGIGLNYRRHAQEGGLELPEFPEMFAKFGNAIADPGSEIAIPAPEADVDYEVELCVVVGRAAKGLQAGSGLDVVAGYTVANDVSARHWQLRVSQWTSGKTSDGFCPIGPWLATPASVPDPQSLHLWTDVNEERVQDSSTADMAFSVNELVVYLSSLMTLQPGDLILTGTPEGVGLGRKPPKFLRAGDVVTVGIDAVGSFSNRFVPAGP
jgi:2-keto-4-pentenoate hydratase/2-oxohepta-3-ene-1,7-dioic acid hydratase in catechol pathway